ncbi:hypothetical protein VNI00_007647 [Paramarasmius palmivorus]|uniref:Uncharacterized protein n=1 Tax=Paramarasmius palmivorus TaxID=297713 RepID=A0AAW0D040_9AGAR
MGFLFLLLTFAPARAVSDARGAFFYNSGIFELSPEESLPQPTFNSTDSELWCIQILPSLSGTRGPCTAPNPSNYTVGHLAASIDGKLLAVSEEKTGEIFVRYGPEKIDGMAFGAQSKLIVSSSRSLSTQENLVRVFDLESESEMESIRALEWMRDKTRDVFMDVLEDASKNIPRSPSISSDEVEGLVSILVWEARFRDDLKHGWAFKGLVERRSTWLGCINPLSNNGRYLISIAETGYPYRRATIIDMGATGDAPRQLFDLPYDSQQAPMHFNNASDPKRSFIAAISRDAQLGIWDAETGEKENSFPIPDDVPHPQFSNGCGIVLSPDGRFAAIQSHKVATLWYIETGEVLLAIPGGQPTFDTFSFSTDAELVYWETNVRHSGGVDKAISVYNTSTAELIREWQVGYLVDRFEPTRRKTVNVMRTQRTATGTLVFTLTDGGIAIFNPEVNGERWISPSRFRCNSSCGCIQPGVIITFSGNGQVLYSSDRDGNIRAWTMIQ